MNTMRAVGYGLLAILVGLAQPILPATAQPRAEGPSIRAEAAAKARINAWTVGLAGGLLEGAPIRFATEIARVVDEVDENSALHVFPVVTRGPTENLEALLYRSEEHTSELQSRQYLVCRLLLEEKKHSRSV